MGELVEVNGVQTYYDTYGDGTNVVVLLHGGLATNDAWGAQLPALTEHFTVFAPERRAHGHTRDVEGPLSYDVMAADTIAFLDQIVGGPASLVGWSDGGVVGLLVAIARPDLVDRLVVIGTNYDVAGLTDGSVSELEHDSPDLIMLRMLYDAESPDGAEHWPVAFGKVKAMWMCEPHISLDDLATIRARTLVLVGDDDAVTLEHTIELLGALPDAELAVVPGTSHLLCLEKPELVNRVIVDFLCTDAVATMMPMRRRAQ